MFGEKSIYGQSVVQTDNKSRITIPSFTFATKGDELVLLKENDYYIILPAKIIDDYLDNLYEIINKSLDKNEINKIKNIIMELSENILCKNTIDGNRRFNTYGNLEINQKFQVIGAKKQIFLKNILTL